MTETTHHEYFGVRVERTDGDTPVELPEGNTRYGSDWEPHLLAREVDFETRIMHAPYDGPVRVTVWWPAQSDDLTDAQTFHFPAGTRTAAMEKQKRHSVRYQELRKLPKARLCQLLRDGGLVWSLHPPEKWTKDEVINGIIEQEEQRRPDTPVRAYVCGPGEINV